MDRLEQYRQYILTILTDHATCGRNPEGVEAQILTDDEHYHYQLMMVGWHDNRRVYGIILHFDIKDGKIWVHYNGTEDPVGDRLVEMGVPKTDIVIGFHSPFKRQFTEFAVG